jgi:hypothetical protein
MSSTSHYDCVERSAVGYFTTPRSIVRVFDRVLLPAVSVLMICPATFPVMRSPLSAGRSVRHISTTRTESRTSGPPTEEVIIPESERRVGHARMPPRSCPRYSPEMPACRYNRAKLEMEVSSYPPSLLTDKEMRISLSVAQVFKISLFSRRECIIYFYLRQSL